MLFAYTRRALDFEHADLDYFILHAQDCERVPPEPFPDRPTLCGTEEEPEWFWGLMETPLALTYYLDRGGGEELIHRVCEKCRPGWVLNILYEENDEFVRTFTERGRR